MRGAKAYLVAAALQPVTWLGWMLATDGDDFVVAVVALVMLAGAIWISLGSIPTQAHAAEQDLDAALQEPGAGGAAVEVGPVWHVRLLHAVGAVFLAFHVIPNDTRDWHPEGGVLAIMVLAMLAQLAAVAFPAQIALRARPT